MTEERQALSIFHGGRAPEDTAKNSEFHQTLLDELAVEVARQGWPGVTFRHYERSTGFVAIEIGPGNGALTLEALRAFRDAIRELAA